MSSTERISRKKIVIAGAGQFGRSAATLLNTQEYELIAFADNNPKVQNTNLTLPTGQTLPVLSVPDAILLKPDTIMTGVIDETRTEELCRQLRSSGFSGEMLTLRSDYLHLDIRSATLIRLAARIRSLQIPGAVAELGVYRGDLAVKLNALFPERTLYLFDTFEGFDLRDVEEELKRNLSRASTSEFEDTSIELVRSRLVHPEKAFFRKGFFPDTAEGLENERYCLVSLDADLYAPILAGLRYFWPRLNKGGMILLHDYGNERFRGARRAVNEFEQEVGFLPLVPLCDLHGTAVIIKT
ncbi:MAG: class I SAM-dependent methyltransferase [Lachnospiraceae bacterium]|nr:class I SAM-dependent methyltransferase [Lachnospiraceae bacterium]